MAPANGSTEIAHAQFEALRNEACNAFARAAVAMRDASQAAENLSNWFSRLTAQNFAHSFHGGSPGSVVYGGPQHQLSAVQTSVTNGRKRKADHEEVIGKKKREPKEKKPKDKDAPKRAPSAYLLYQNDVRKEIKEQNPNISNTELLQIISKKWTTLEPEKRRPYVDKHEKMKGEYETAKEVYDNKLNAAEQEIAAVEKPKSKSSVTKSGTRAPEKDDGDDQDEDDDQDEENEEREVSGAASIAGSTSAETSSSASSSDEEDEAQTPEPPKKKSKKEVKAPIPPPVKPAKDRKKHKRGEK